MNNVVTYEQAKKISDAGFRTKTLLAYGKDGLLCVIIGDNKIEGMTPIKSHWWYENDKNFYYLPAPSVIELVKYLSDNFSYSVSIWIEEYTGLCVNIDTRKIYGWSEAMQSLVDIVLEKITERIKKLAAEEKAEKAAEEFIKSNNLNISSQEKERLAYSMTNAWLASDDDNGGKNE